MPTGTANQGPVLLHGGRLTIEDVVQVARHGAPVELTDEATARIEASRRVVDDLVDDGQVAYGITTGFGEFAHVTIEASKVEDLQRNLIMSHSVGRGEPLPREIVRAMMLIRVETFCIGLSGIRPETARLLVDMLNADVIPCVPSKGSLGASGDLAPLAHMVLPMIGLGEVLGPDDRPVDGAAALRKAGLEPVTLGAKEGLALINGTCLMSAHGALLVHDAERIVANALVAGAMSLEALQGTDQAFIPEVSMVRPHPGQARAAEVLFALTQNSGTMTAHRDCPKVQDAYTLRCMPQVYGAVMDALAYVRRVVSIELRSVTDNPLVFADRSVSCGNFHGEPLALALDFFAIAMTDLSNMIERRVDRLVNPHVSGMTAFLVESGGLNSGFMVAQYTAASLVAENKVLAHPASVDSIPTSANQEDHVSMGATAATKAARVLDNVWDVLAIEYLCAAQGIDFKRPDKAGPGVEAAWEAVRAVVPKLEADRVLAPDVTAIRRELEGDRVLERVRAAGFDVDVVLDRTDLAPTIAPTHATPDPVNRRRARGGDNGGG